MLNSNFLKFQIPRYGSKSLINKCLKSFRIDFISNFRFDLQAIGIWNLKNWNLITYSFKRNFISKTLDF